MPSKYQNTKNINKLNSKFIFHFFVFICIFFFCFLRIVFFASHIFFSPVLVVIVNLPHKSLYILSILESLISNNKLLYE
jgi:hypothetical protein